MSNVTSDTCDACQLLCARDNDTVNYCIHNGDGLYTKDSQSEHFSFTRDLE